MNYYDIKAVSNSLLGEVKHQHIYNKPRFTKRSQKYLRFGRGLHEAILEPEHFDPHQYTGAERLAIIRMSDAFRTAYPDIFDGCVSFEKEYFWQYKGWNCKAKVDAVLHDDGTLVDLKTTKATTQDEFEAACMEYEYDRQAAWYLSAVDDKFDQFKIIGISKGNYQTFEVNYFYTNLDWNMTWQEIDAILGIMDASGEYENYKA